MQSKPQQENVKESNLFPDQEVESNLFGELEKPDLIQIRSVSPVESDLFPTEGLYEIMTPPEVDIGLTTKEDLKQSNIILRLLGISQGIDSALKSKGYQMLDQQASVLEEEGGWTNRFMANQMREAQSWTLAASSAFSIADFESRPRKVLENLIAVSAQKKLERAREPGVYVAPATRADYRRAVSDAISGKGYMDILSGIEANIAPGSVVAKDRFLARHSTLRVADNVNKTLSNYIIAMGMEVGISKVAKMPVKGLKKGLDSLSDAVIGMKYAKPSKTDSIDDMLQEAADAIVKGYGEKDAIGSFARVLEEDPNRMDELYDLARRMYQNIAERQTMQGAYNIPSNLIYIVKERMDDTTEWHEVAHAIWWKYLDDAQRTAWSKEYTNIIKEIDVATEGKAIFDSVPDIEEFLPTAYAVMDEKEAFGEAFAYLVTGKPIPERTLEPFTKIFPDLVVRGRNAAQSEKGLKYLLDPVVAKTGTKIMYIDAATEALIPTLKNMSPEDILKWSVYRRWVEANIQHVNNPEGSVPQEAVGKLIEALTQGQKRMYTELSPNELEDLALEMETIKNMPEKFRRTALETIRRKTYGPPVNTFARLGLARRWDVTTDSIYRKQDWVNRRALWMIDAKRQFKKAFGKDVDFTDANDTVNQAMSYAAEGIGYDDIPVTEDMATRIQDMVTRQEYDWLSKKAVEDAGSHWEVSADISEAQGKISSDPVKIAAGVAPREKNYYGRIHEDIKKSFRKRAIDAAEAGKGLEVPIDYDLDRIIKKGRVPKGQSAASWIARESTKDDYSRNWGLMSQIKWREQMHDLLVREEMLINKALIDALPDTPAKGTAKRALIQWHNSILNTRSEVDNTLNEAFNIMSQRMEKILPFWEAREKSFDHFANFMTRRVDQGLLLGNLRPVVRNPFQIMLNTDIYGFKATLWGFQQLLTPGGRKLLQTSQTYLQRGVPLGAFDITDPGHFKRLTYFGISATDKYLNVASTYLAGWQYYFSQSRRSWDELVSFAAKRGISETSLRRGSTFADTVAEAVNAGMFADARRTIDYRGTALTQWLYDPAGMPPILRSKASRIAGQYQTWTSYMWGAHMPQVIDQAIRGKDIFGMDAPLSVRLAIVGLAAKMGLLYVLGQEIGVNLTYLAVHTASTPTGYIAGKEVPVPVSPIVGTLVGLGMMGFGALQANDKLMSQGVDQLGYSMKSYIPLYGLYRQVSRVQQGKQGLLGILVPLGKPEEEEAALKELPGFKGLPGLPMFPGRERER